MSILGSQCDRLRDRADVLRMLASGMDAPYIVPSTKETMALAMQSAASELREAADTIESLRDRLQESECEVIQSDNGPKCSNCGKELPHDPYADYEGNFCATCGARIRKAVKR